MNIIQNQSDNKYNVKLLPSVLFCYLLFFSCSSFYLPQLVEAVGHSPCDPPKERPLHFVYTLILLSSLEHCMEIHRTVLNWFRSCLNNQCFTVNIDSRSVLPQGSVLGPVLFLSYMLGIYLKNLVFLSNAWQMILRYITFYQQWGRHCHCRHCFDAFLWLGTEMAYKVHPGFVSWLSHQLRSEQVGGVWGQVFTLCKNTTTYTQIKWRMETSQ